MLRDYNNPWLVYSKELAGGLCKDCILFDPVESNVNRGIFVKRAFRDFSKPENISELVQTQYHNEAILRALDSTSDLNFLHLKLVKNIDLNEVKDIFIDLYPRRIFHENVSS